jgi:hypothetical protein
VNQWAVREPGPNAVHFVSVEVKTYLHQATDGNYRMRPSGMVSFEALDRRSSRGSQLFFEKAG